MDKINSEIVRSEADVLNMLDDLLEKRDSEWWDSFYSDKSKPIPIFTDRPDENLVSYIEKGIFKPGKVLDVGCGNGRNSIFLAKSGFQVDAIDFSQKSIDWACENARSQSVEVNFYCDSIFNLCTSPHTYDYIFDSGCLHHIKPHRRNQYLKTIYSMLKPEGHFGLVCFNLKGGANISDYDVYREYSMKGGLAYTEEKLKDILEPFFNILEFREMQETVGGEIFGKDFLWAVLARPLQNE